MQNQNDIKWMADHGRLEAGCVLIDIIRGEQVVACGRWPASRWNLIGMVDYIEIDSENMLLGSYLSLYTVDQAQLMQFLVDTNVEV